MQFKENLTKIAKSVGDGATSVAKKSSNMIEVTKLNVNIQSEEEEIKSRYCEMGVIVYKKFKNQEDVDPDLKHLCKSIEKHEANIKELKQKVLDIKKLKLCVDCGSELESNAIFCPKCGSKQNERSNNKTD